MRKSKVSLLLCLFTVLLLTFMSAGKVSADSPNVNRIFGIDRYETNLSVVKNGWSEAENVVIANGENYPDALCAAPLAKAKNAPIILSSKDQLSNPVLDELIKLKTKNVYIIGGTGVISTHIEEQLKSLEINCTRFAGQDRFETSVKVAEQLNSENGIAVASGENFPDALSIAPIAAKLGMPILLSSRTSLSQSAKNYLQDKNVPVSYIIGGVGVLNANVKASLKNPKRLSGMDRYETNIRILREFEDSLDLNSAFIASANDFPDALSGSVLASNYSSSIILVDKPLLQVTSDYLKEQNYKTVNILGGIGAVNSLTENSIKSVIKYTPITKVDNISDVAFINEEYHFPTTALATYEDSSTKLVPVKWSSNYVDTSKPSSYTFEGTVSGYPQKITMTLKVEEENGSINGNGGNIIYYKGSIYFSSSKNRNAVYRIKSGSSEAEIISNESIADINIVNNYIYYRNMNDQSKIYRMDLDGSNKTKIVDEPTENIVVIGDWIYYSYYSQSDSGMCKVKTDGSNKVKLSDDYSYDMDIVDGYIYYISEKDGLSIYKMKIDGSERTKLDSNSSNYVSVAGDWIYFTAIDGTYSGLGPMENIHLYKMKTDGTGKVKITEDDIRGITLYNDWIYYGNYSDGGKLYKIRTDGSDKTKMTDIKASVVTITGDWIFYVFPDYNSAYFIMKLDGSSNQRFIIPNIPEKESNNSLLTAQFLDIPQGLGDAISLDGNLEYNDVDYFKFTPWTNYYLNVAFSSPSLGSNATISITDSDGNELYSTKTKYDGTASFRIHLNSSIYFLKVSSPNGSLLESDAYNLQTWYDYGY
ncbi:DUF5050 domain-containing protein [Clostridium sp. PL3]|uniref:DUF5050 domain-containing protein n=1 Tax=Clostridium thailandense TaxID=2794346 RepID=A0A949TTH7_9CLOT|nr:cell wall-binding repeat-containing protein [Clostridium thailandense]MBV7272078.1 DUF5050 domain-containing protein [Clostridium thailandense]